MTKGLRVFLYVLLVFIVLIILSVGFYVYIANQNFVEVKYSGKIAEGYIPEYYVSRDMSSNTYLILMPQTKRWSFSHLYVVPKYGSYSLLYLVFDQDDRFQNAKVAFDDVLIQLTGNVIKSDGELMNVDLMSTSKFNDIDSVKYKISKINIENFNVVNVDNEFADWFTSELKNGF